MARSDLETRTIGGRGDRLAEWGSLALASRLRRLLERLARDGRAVYRSLDLEFEPSWFPSFHLLSQHSPLSVVEIAEALGQSHPTVIQVVDEMTSRGLIVSRRDSRDRRRRELSLSPSGRALLDRLEPVWRAFAEAGTELTTEDENDFLSSLSKLEQALSRRSMIDRILEKNVKPKKGTKA